MGGGKAAQPDPEGLVLSLMPIHSGLRTAFPFILSPEEISPFLALVSLAMTRLEDSGLYKRCWSGHPRALVQIGPGPQPLSLVPGPIARGGLW